MNNEYVLLAAWLTAIVTSFNSQKPLLGILAFLLMILHLSVHHYTKQRDRIALWGVVSFVFPLLASFQSPTEVISLFRQDDLFQLCENSTASFQLMNDIILTNDFNPYQDERCVNYTFYGEFDGNNHTIFNPSFPLFGYTPHSKVSFRGMAFAEVYDLRIANPRSPVILSSSIYASKINNIHITDIDVTYLNSTDTFGHDIGGSLLAQHYIVNSSLTNITLDHVFGEMNKLVLISPVIQGSNFASINLLNIHVTTDSLVLLSDLRLVDSEFTNFNITFVSTINHLSLVDSRDPYDADFDVSIHEITLNHMNIYASFMLSNEFVFTTNEEIQIIESTLNGIAIIDNP